MTLQIELLRLLNMQQAIDAFRQGIDRAEHLGGLYQALSGLMTAAVDASDLLRAQIVLGVSALDYYVHEITVLGMMEIFSGTRTASTGFHKYRVSAGAMSQCIATSSGIGFESDIRERHSFLSFQQPEKIADAIRLFSDVKLWSEVGLKMGRPEQDIKNELKLVVDRRNKIAHEADIDPSYPGSRWPITPADVQRSLTFLRNLGDSIHALVA